MQKQVDQSTDVLSKLNDATPYQFDKSADAYIATINLDSARALRDALAPYVAVSLDSNEAVNKRLPPRDRRATLRIEAAALEKDGVIAEITNHKDQIYWQVYDNVAKATSAHRPGCKMGR